MFVRLVQMDIDPGRVGEYGSIYESKILPALARTPGCVYGALVVNARQKDRAVSVTLWESEAHVNAYERSGRYAELIDVLRPYFSESMNWQLRFSVDMRLEHIPSEAEPVVRTYVGSAEHGTEPPALHGLSGFLRIVSMIVRRGAVEDFTRLYRDHVLAQLRAEPGCCSIQLAESVADPREFISFTIWENRESAERYEASGRFESLRKILEPTLSSLYQWKLQQEGGPGRLTATSEDVTVDAYVVLTARSFGEVQAA